VYVIINKNLTRKESDIIVLAGICALGITMSTPTAGVSDYICPNVQELYSQYHELESLQVIDATPSEADLETESNNLNILTPISITPVYGAVMKTYEDYRVFSKSSNQYKLQQMCYTDERGLRYIDYNGIRFYCCAVGSAVSEDIGRLGTLILDDGNEINIVVSDVKDDRHTDDSNVVTVHSKCASEFVVDVESLDRNWKRMGSVFYELGNVEKIMVYDNVVE
jgi:hypothetical protein